MSDSLLDFASLETAAAAVETPVDDTPAEETPAVDSAVEETPAEETAGEETETHNADGTEKTPEEQAAFKEAQKTAAASKGKGEELPGTEKTPQEVRKALKAFKEASPENAAMVKQLHGSYERHQAYKAEFPTVQAAKEAKNFIESIGGIEGYQKTVEMADAVKAADDLLYAADPKIWDNVIEDLKSVGKLDALAKLAPSFLEKLKSVDDKGYYETFTPHFYEGLNEVHIPEFINQFNTALAAKNEKGEPAPDINAITGLVKNITKWYNDLKTNVEAKKPLDTPERRAFLKEKEEFEKSKATEAQTKQKEYENNVAEEADKYNNKALGKALGTYLRMPFFKDFPYETKVDLGNGIKEKLYATLKADKVYQQQMTGFWKMKPTAETRAKIMQFHQIKLDAIADDVVKAVVQNRYPNYAKGGSAAGRVAAAAAKKVASTKAAVQSTVSGKPIYVAVRPSNLVREPITVNGREYSVSDLTTLQITGRGFVKSADGKTRYVTWRKPTV